MSGAAFETGNPDVSLLRPIVIDNGTGVIKCGFAGEDRPTALFPNLVGRPKHHKVMASTRAEGDHFVGRDADELRGLLRLSRPMSHGRVADWQDMERVWYSVYHSHLRTASDAHPVLLTESPLNPLANRARAAEVFFDAFNAPAMFVTPQVLWSLCVC
jgi:centractin